MNWNIFWAILLSGLTETWLTRSTPDAAVSMSEYNTFRRDMGKGRDVLLYIKNTLKCEQIVFSNEIELECIGVTISLSPEMPFTLICIYRKQSATIDFYNQLKILFG